MYIGLGSLVEVDSTNIVLVTSFTPPATEFERVDISALADTKEQATLGRQKLQEIEVNLNWKPSDSSHVALKTKAEAKTEFTLVLKFVDASKKWTCTQCKIESLGAETVEHGKVLARKLKIICNGTVTESAA